MNEASAILAALAAVGATARLSATAQIVVAPRSKVPAELWVRLKANRDAVADYLRYWVCVVRDCNQEVFVYAVREDKTDLSGWCIAHNQPTAASAAKEKP